MKNALFGLLLLLVGTTHAVTVSDDFTGTGALSGDWTIQSGALARNSDNLAGSTADYNRAVWNSTSFENDQFSRIVCGTYGANSYQVLSVRSSGSGGTLTQYFYTFSESANNADVFRVVSGSATKIVDVAESYGVGSPGDTVELKVEGSGTSTLLTVSINGVSIFTYTDNSGSAIASGAPGVGTFRADSRVAWWQGGDYAEEGGGPEGLAGRKLLLGVGK